MRHRLILRAAALALTTCTTAGPNYALPESATANLPAAIGAFDSGRDKAFAQADLRAADANLARADAVVQEVAAAHTLSTVSSGGVTLTRPYATGASLPGTVGYDLGIGLAYPLDLSGKIRRAIEAAQGDAKAVAAARDNIGVAIAAEVARGYAAACSANLTLAANARVLGAEPPST